MTFTEVFSKSQRKELLAIMNKHPGAVAPLKEFCRKHEGLLEKHGLTPDYTAYLILYLSTK